MFTEKQQIKGRRLGRRQPKRAPAIRFKNVWTGQIPQHPDTADHFAEVSDWGLYGNDQFGDCGPTSVANQRKLVTRYLGDQEVSPSQDDVFDLYRRSGNPNFDPSTGEDDNGVDMQTMCEALVSGGIAGTKALAFASVDVSNQEEVRAAIAIFGSVLYGVNLETAQQQQTDQGEWTYKRSGEWGGHAVLGGRYGQVSAKSNEVDVSVITWEEVVKMTESFEKKQVEEAWVVVWPEHLGSKSFQEGVDQAQLAAYYKALTGRDFPAPAPTPSPTPTPAPGDGPDSSPITELVQLIRQAEASFEAWAQKHGF